MNKFFAILLFFVLGCAHKAPKPVLEASPKVSEKSPRELIKITTRPGEVVKLKFKFENQISSIKCTGDDIPVFNEKDSYVAYVATSYWAKMGDFDCLSGNEKIATFTVTEKDFPSETLKVNPKRVELSAVDQKRVQTEQIFLNGVYQASPLRPLFHTPFELPINADVTSIYGSRRVFNNKKQTQHLGTDFRAPVGEKIFAANAGKVVVARDLFFTGLTVTIDHGLGIFTIYGHLSKLNVIEGEMVPRGTVIGLSGATGRVTGPHLHWGVKVNGHFIEGESLVATSKE